MAYREIRDEYVSLLQEKTDILRKLNVLKSGYISTKKISKREYKYLQYRVKGKLISEYIRKCDLNGVIAQLNERTSLQERLTHIDIRIEKLENASELLDSGLKHTLIILRRCAAMEAMSLEERCKSIGFGNAMTAIEGLPVKYETEQNLTAWAEGRIAFHDCFISTLKAYHLAEVLKEYA